MAETDRTLDIYTISGLGADDRLFQHLDFPPHCSLTHLNWLNPINRKESLLDYCRRLAWKIDTGRPHLLIGISFGGIVAQEVAKLTKPRKVVLISSIKHPGEFPPYLRTLGALKLHNALPESTMKSMAKMAKSAFGVRNTQGALMFADMVDKNPDGFFAWAMQQILIWKDKDIPSNLLHLHGTKDLIFPHKYLKEPYISVAGGSHAMTMEYPKEISEILGAEIEKVSVA